MTAKPAQLLNLLLHTPCGKIGFMNRPFYSTLNHEVRVAIPHNKKTETEAGGITKKNWHHRAKRNICPLYHRGSFLTWSNKAFKALSKSVSSRLNKLTRCDHQKKTTREHNARAPVKALREMRFTIIQLRYQVAPNTLQDYEHYV